MKPWVKWTLGALIVGGYVACSPKQFSSGGCDSSSSGCIATPYGNDYNESTTVEGGKVDILVVDDNSASMSTEQAHLGTRFNGFIQNLENKHIDYRIAVTTTDISGAGNEARAVNQNGALQDGRLIAFPGGSKYLTTSSGSLAQKDTAFKGVVQRSETAGCETFIKNWLTAGTSTTTQAYRDAYYQNCPSGDERGIVAARLVMENNPDSFIRSDADLAIIVLSDEDERSGNYRAGLPQPNPVEKQSYDPAFALTDYDLSQSFVNMMTSRYPTKTYGVHPIIVQTNDTACLSIQNSQTMNAVSGSYGVEYEWLRYRTNGTQGSICASDYTAILQNIFDNVQGKIVDKVTLACANPKNLQVTLTNNSDPAITWSVVGNELRFNKKLPVGTIVQRTYHCDGVN